MGFRARVRSTHRLPAGVFACALLLVAIATGCDPKKPLAISAAPALFPEFKTEITDYVIRCDDATPVTVSVEAPAGTTVSVDGQPEQTGKFDVTVVRDVGQRFDMVVNDVDDK